MTASLWFSRITPSFNWSLLRLVGAKNHNIPTAPRKEPGSPNSEPPKFWCLATARKTLRPHTGPQGDSTHFQFTASTIEFTLFLLQVGMCFCPFHTTASVWIHMHAANLAPIQFSCSFPTYQPPIPSMTATGVWEFRLWDQVGQVEPILHMGCPVLFRNIFSRSPCHGTNLGLLQPSSSCLFIEQYVLFLPFIFMDRRYPVHSWPPINGAGSKYKKKSVHDLKTETRMTLRFARARTTTRGTKHPQQWRHIAFVQSLVVVISLFFFQL